MTMKKENWRILTNKEIYAMVKKPTITEIITLNRLCWFGHVLIMEVAIAIHLRSFVV